MLCTLSYCPRDQDITLQLFDWIAELGTERHKLLLCHDNRCGSDIVKKIYDSASKSFEIVRDIEAKAQIDGWPEGANYFFRTITAELSYQKNIKYFLWLEPDAIPIKKGWIEEIETEYLKAQKPFMGDDVNVDNVPRHMSGIGVYPNPIYNFAGEANRAAETAWDVAAAEQIVPQAHFTELIVHNWKHEAFKDQGELENLMQNHPEMVLFHSDKSFSLPKLLTAVPVLAEPDVKLTLQSPKLASEGEARESTQSTLSGDNKTLDSRGGGQDFQPQGRPEIAGAPTSTVLADIWNNKPVIATGRNQSVGSIPTTGLVTDIFIRTYPQDYPWLEYSLKSIHKFCTGFRKIWIVSPAPNPASAFFDPQFIEWKVLNEESEDGYLSQQIHKLYADVITGYEADYILHLDSDVLITRPTQPKDFFKPDKEVYPFTIKDDKLIWYYTPYEFTQTPWQPITEKFMCKPVQHEFMRRLPMMIPKWLYPKLREYCHMKHGDILSNYIKKQPTREFSEFNALGAFAYEKFRDKFEWVNTHEQPIPGPCSRQFFSWSGITDEVKKEIETILNGGVEKSQETHWQNGKDIPEGESLTAHSSGSEISPRQTSEGSVSPVQNSNGESPRFHIRALAEYADLPWKRQYVINQLKKQFKSKRKKKLVLVPIHGRGIQEGFPE